VVVRLQDRSQTERFQQLGALIVDPGLAIVSLLDHLVRSPEGASLLLGLHRGQDIVDLEMRSNRLDGMALRDVRLPGNTLILSIRRGEEWLVSRGYTRLRLGDKVTAMGSRDGLDQLAMQLEA
jgi:Trk K+ transport system NAD-binding subunit